MAKAKELLLLWKTVFKEWKYFILGIVTALIFYEVNALIPSYKTLSSVYPAFGFIGTVKLLSIISLGFYQTIKLHSFISLIIISILLGMLVSLITYKTKILKSSSSNKKHGMLATAGIFLGVLAPGCAACGVGILSILGLSAAFITFLPFDGLEISILSIAILAFTIFSISKSLLNQKTCKIQLQG